jgi:hypothetical protein
MAQSQKITAPSDQAIQQHLKNAIVAGSSAKSE